MIDFAILFKGLGQNIALLLSLTLIYSWLLPSLKSISPLRKSLIIGILFGGITIIGMLLHIQIAPGVFIDGRVIVVAVAGFLGGTVSAIIAGIMASICRIFLVRWSW